MQIIGQKWKLPILWYLADAENQTLRYRELERKVIGITATMLTKCLWPFFGMLQAHIFAVHSAG